MNPSSSDQIIASGHGESSRTFLERAREFANRAPSGPIGQAALLNRQGEHLPWSVVEEQDGKITVYAPKNLESYADNFMIISALNAIFALGDTATILPSKMDGEVDQYKSIPNKVQAYFSGIACALHKRTIASNPKYSGTFGSGFNWVVNTWFDHHQIKNVMLDIKYDNPVKVLTGKVWETNVTAEQQRIFALLRRGAKAVNIEQPSTYLRSFESLSGDQIKGSLKFKREGILQSLEVKHLTNKASSALKSYEALKVLIGGTLSTLDMVALPGKIQAVNAALKPFDHMADEIVRQRLSVLLPSAKKARDIALKRPMQDLINDLEGEEFIELFNPALVAGLARFRIDHNLIEDERYSPAETKTVLIDQYDAYIRNIQDDEFRLACHDWFIGQLAGKLNL